MHSEERISRPCRSSPSTQAGRLHQQSQSEMGQAWARRQTRRFAGIRLGGLGAGMFSKKVLHVGWPRILPMSNLVGKPQKGPVPQHSQAENKHVFAISTKSPVISWKVPNAKETLFSCRLQRFNLRDRSLKAK